MTSVTIEQWALGQVIDAATRVAVAGERNRLREWAEVELARRTAPGSYAKAQRTILRQVIQRVSHGTPPLT